MTAQGLAPVPMAPPRSGPVVLITLYDGFTNLNLRWIHGVLKQAGHDCKVIRFGKLLPFEKDTDYSLFQPFWVKPPLVRPPLDPGEVRALQDTVAGLDPCWIGFSVLAPINHVAGRLTSAVREVCDAPVVWGGYYAISQPEFCLRHADAVCTGEGEEVAVALTEEFKSGRRDFSAIKGLWYRSDAGEIHRNPLRPFLTPAQLDALPATTYERTGDEILIPTDLRDYFENKLAKCDGGKINSAAYQHDVMAARGCWFACTFCWRNREVRSLSGRGLSYRMMSPGRAVEHARLALSTGKKRVGFWDEIFPVDRDWVAEFAALYKERVGLPLTVITHGRLMTDENMEALIAAGLDSVILGIQTGCERARREVYHRPETNAELQALAAKWHHRMFVTYEIITDNPYETVDDLREAVAFFLSLPQPFGMDANTLMYQKECEITQWALRDGWIGSDDVLGEGDHPGPEDVTTQPVVPRSDPVRRSLQMLVLAATYGWIPRELVAGLAADDAVLADPVEVEMRILQEMYRFSRRQMYEYEWEMMRLYNALREGQSLAGEREAART
ncbi:MAG: radical SAM protein [Sumerlaeia bacterium]